MRHRKSGRKLGRSSSHRDAMFRNMAVSLIEEEKIQTTSAKAKELRRVVEPLITLGKRNPKSAIDACTDPAEKQRLVAKRLAAVRHANKTISERYVLEKLFGEIAERYVERPGGYTRIIKLGRRLGDNAELSIIELVRDDEPAPAQVEAPEADDDGDDLAEG